MARRFTQLLLLAAVSLTSVGLAEGGPAAPTLEEKLDHQFSRYAFARQHLLASERPVSREDWESWLRGEGPDALTAGDLTLLRASQRQRIEAARRQAAAASLFDLARLRDQPAETRAFCAALPKGGLLHVHPWGTLTRETGRKLLVRRNPVLAFQQMAADFVQPENHVLLYPAELQWLRGLGADAPFLQLAPADQDRYVDFFVLPPGNHPFERFDSVFLFLDTAIGDMNDLETALDDFARRAAAEGVLYTELTTGVSTRSLPAWSAMLQRAEATTGLTIRLNDAFLRTASADELAASLADLERLPENPWVVGIDFLGNERLAPALEAGQTVYGTVLRQVLAGKSQLHRTMHAGELGDPRDPRDAMLLGAERLGHGVLLAEDPVALEYAARHHVPVEINLTSNLRLEAVADLRHHPFLDYLRLGLPVSLSTDDEGIFETDIDQECVTAIEVSDVTYAELKAMVYNSLSTSFLKDDEKAALRTKLDGQFAAFERQELTQAPWSAGAARAGAPRG